LQRRLPKRGFRNPFRKEFEIVNLGRLEEVFENGAVIDAALLAERGLVRRGLPVKVLGQGALTKALTIKVQAFSATAKERIAAAGGSTEVIASA
ncbi:MAG: large ribosomal subunit protein uL15, partial [Mycobacterium sp.]